ncbi:MAG: IclR family transcriptional regulator [Ilumatobacteraceae bacterium]
MNNDGVTRSATLGSVANAARVLKSFTPAERNWGVSDLARKLDIAKSTAHRLLATLTDEGLLEQDPATGRYHLGLAVFDMAAAAQSMDLHEAVSSPMTELRNRTRETVQVAVLDGRDVVYVERLDSQHTLRLFLEVGRRNPAHATGCGKALLAFLPPDQLDRTLRGWTLVAKTHHTIIDHAVLRADLTTARQRGYAVNREESEVGIISVAAPIRDVSGRVSAAISVAGPCDRLEAHELPLAQATMEVAALVSRRLGHRGHVGAA